MEKAKGTRGNPGGRGAPIVQSSDTTAQLTCIMQRRDVSVSVGGAFW